MFNANAKNEANVWKACCEIVGQEGTPLDSHASLIDLGIDSLGLAELVIQLEESYGEGCINVDDILANPIISQIAAKLSDMLATPVAFAEDCVGAAVCCPGHGPALPDETVHLTAQPDEAAALPDETAGSRSA